MKCRDLPVIAVTAFAVMLATIALRQAMPAAIAEQKSVKKEANKPPTLIVDGVALSLTFKKSDCKAGQKPKVELLAINTSKRPVKLKATDVMTTTPEPQPMARMLPRPSEVWSNTCKLKLKPGESQTIALQTKVALESGSTISFIIKVGKKSITAATCSVQSLSPTPANSPVSTEAPSGSE